VTDGVLTSGRIRPTLKSMESLESYCDRVKSQGVDDALIVKTSSVFTAPWVRLKCQFGCSGYGERLCCPPRTPTPDETRRVLDSYSVAILLHRHWQKSYGTVNNFNDIVIALEKSLFLDGFYKAFGLGSGPCMRCSECNITGTCRNGEQARPAMEACGIDVFRTAREQGLPIHVVRNHKAERDIYGLVLVE
jgi:predicted metal-binding protein